MKKIFTKEWWGPMELSGTGISSEESDFIVLPDNDPKLKTAWEEICEGPYELCGTGASSEESDLLAV